MRRSLAVLPPFVAECGDRTFKVGRSRDVHGRAGAQKLYNPLIAELPDRPHRLADRSPRKPAYRALTAATIISILAFIILMVTAPAASAQYTVICENPGIGCIAFSGYAGQSVWGYPVDSKGNNCTNYAAYRLAINGVLNPGNLGNAAEWATNAAAKGFLVNQTPAVGAIAQWNSGSAYAPVDGHVAYVEEVGSGYIVETESNWEGPSRRVTITEGDQFWPNHFIHFKDVAGGGGGTPHHVPLGDWNGDGKTDYTTYDPMSGEWRPYLNGTGNPGYEWTTWGGPGWIPVPGDYNGDGRTDPAIYNPTNGEWRPYINNPGGEHGYEWTTWGGPGWIPVPGDYNGDGKTDYTIYNPATGEWRPYINNPGGPHGWPWVKWGAPGEIPVPGDYNGDGKTDYATYSPTTGWWRIYINGPNPDYEWVQWGGPGWIPLPYDWNGDGRTDFVIYNPRTGELRPYINNPGGEHGYEWELWGGGPNEVPVVGDWNGDGRADIATYNLTSGLWRPYLTNPGGEHGWPWPTWGGGDAIPVVDYRNLLWYRQFFPPTATFTAETNALTVAVDGSASHDAYAGSPASWEWNFGDGSTGTGAVASHSYTAAGSYTVTLTVRDVLGAVASISHVVDVTAPSAGASNVESTTPGRSEANQKAEPSSKQTASTMPPARSPEAQRHTFPAPKPRRYQTKVDVSEHGMLTVRWIMMRPSTSRHERRTSASRKIVVASGRREIRARGQAVVTMRLTRWGAQHLNLRRTLRVRAVIIFQPTNGRRQIRRRWLVIQADSLHTSR